ncbi:hypothetical protein BCM40_12505 [Planococcus donghaensis]|uniref:Uncharacterized protein n=1 Tax=Planococcus donghaensis TaxID=414778 RepID=A0A1C7EJ97_9BACL|nr:hypothetical protein BCM40_12505 [Planococcus donghaensis]
MFLAPFILSPFISTMQKKPVQKDNSKTACLDELALLSTDKAPRKKFKQTRQHRELTFHRMEQLSACSHTLLNVTVIQKTIFVND